MMQKAEFQINLDSMKPNISYLQGAIQGIFYWIVCFYIHAQRSKMFLVSTLPSNLFFPSTPKPHERISAVFHGGCAHIVSVKNALTHAQNKTNFTQFWLAYPQ